MRKDSNRKIICMIAQASYPGDPRIRRQAEALEREGFEVDVLCRPSGVQPKVETFGKVTAYRIANAPRQESMLKWIYYSTLFLIKAFLKIQTLHFKRRYSVIQIHNMPDHLIFSAIIQKLMGVRLVIDIHDLTVELFQEKWKGKKVSLIIGVAKFLEKISLKIANKVITVTGTCKERLVSRGVPRNKIELVLNTPDENIFVFNKEREFGKINKNLRLLYYGSVAHRFGLHTAVKAMKFINNEIPDSVLDIYGSYDTSYGNYLREKIKEFDLQDAVRLNGKVTRDQIPGIIAAADIGIVPYLSTDYMNLALPTKAFEYIAAGLPVVSTHLEDLSKSFGENSIAFVSGENPEALADKIIYLSKKPELRNSMVKNAYSDMQKISGKVMSKRYVNLMNDLCNNDLTLRVVGNTSSANNFEVKNVKNNRS